MTGVDWLEGVSQFVGVAHHVVKVPALAALLDPAVHVMTEGAERNQGVVRRAAPEDLGAGVTDVRVAHGLLHGAVVIVQLSSQQRKPLAKIEDLVEVEVGRASLDQQHLALGQVGREPGGNDAASSTAANNDVVVRGLGALRKVLRSHGDAVNDGSNDWLQRLGSDG